MRTHRTLTAALLAAGFTAALLTVGLSLRAQDVDKRVLDAEKKRTEIVDKVKPSVVAIFAPGGQGGGSGVLISKDGYALTNFHVVGRMITMKCGLADGVMYDAVLVGLDKMGDVALIKLVQKDGKDFPFAKLGDSDKVKAGDWSLAMGNPFLLATDFNPTVTYGLISGTHRYQYPEGGGLLEYTDCIQIDTSINPGNSGGPLFDMDGKLIGINGRGSFDKRSRINSGVGYAISINQIKNFLGHLHAGIDTDHATLGATVGDDKDEEAGLRMVVRGILDDCDVKRRGLDTSDELIEFAGRQISNVNEFKNILGIFPKGWRVPLTYRHNNEKKEILARLMGAQARIIQDPKNPMAQPQQPAPAAQGPAAKFYEAKKGFANFYFNKQHRDRLLAAFKKQGDFAGLTGAWEIDAAFETKKKKGESKIVLKQDKDKDNKIKAQITMFLDGLKYDLEPLKLDQDVRDLLQPTGSGGLMMALHHYRLLLTQGEKGFVNEKGESGQFSHGGFEPFYVPRADGQAPKQLSELRVDCEVLLTELNDQFGKWYFALKDRPGIPAGTLIGFELRVERDEDPCEVFFYDFKQVDGRALPHRFVVHHKNDAFGTFVVKEYKLAKGN